MKNNFVLISEYLMEKIVNKKINNYLNEYSLNIFENQLCIFLTR